MSKILLEVVFLCSVILMSRSVAADVVEKAISAEHIHIDETTVPPRGVNPSCNVDKLKSGDGETCVHPMDNQDESLENFPFLDKLYPEDDDAYYKAGELKQDEEPQEDIGEGRKVSVTVNGKRYQGISAVNATNITQVLADTNHALITFYAHWDIYSMAMLNAISQVRPMTASNKARRVLQDIHASVFHDDPFAGSRPQPTNVSLLAMDAFLEESVRAHFGVVRFPTVYYVERGIIVGEYMGPVCATTLTRYIDRMFGLSMEGLRGPHDFNLALSASDLTLVVYAPTKKGTFLRSVQQTLSVVAHSIPVHAVYADQTVAAEPYEHVLKQVPTFSRHETMLLSLYRKRLHRSGIEKADTEIFVFMSQLNDAVGEAEFLEWIQSIAPHITELFPRSFQEHYTKAVRERGGMVILAQRTSVVATQAEPHVYNANHVCLEQLRSAALAASQLSPRPLMPLRYFYIDVSRHREFLRRLCVDTDRVIHTDECEYATLIPSELPMTFVTSFVPVDALDLLENQTRCDPRLIPQHSQRKGVSIEDSLYHPDNFQGQTAVWKRLGEENLQEFLQGCFVYVGDEPSSYHEMKQPRGRWTNELYENQSPCTHQKAELNALVIVSKTTCAFCLQLFPALRTIGETVRKETVQLQLGYINVEVDTLPRALSPVVGGYPEILYLNKTHVVSYGGYDRSASGILGFVNAYSGYLIQGATQSRFDKPWARRKFQHFRLGAKNTRGQLKECPDEKII